jgi:hypothetical protein
MVYKHTWLIIFSGFFEPLFYLLSIGVGIGKLVGHVTGPGGHAIDYRAFVAPALLAASAMNGAVYESTMNIFFKLKYAHTYDAILATPVGVGDVALGEIAWSLFRGVLYSTGFLIVMAALGDVLSWWAILALPAAVLIGFGFASVGMACTTFMRSWQDFDFVQPARIGGERIEGGGEVSLLLHLLSARHLSALAAVGRRVHPAVPGSGAAAWPHDRYGRLGSGRPRPVPGPDGRGRCLGQLTPDGPLAPDLRHP